MGKQVCYTNMLLGSFENDGSSLSPRTHSGIRTFQDCLRRRSDRDETGRSSSASNRFPTVTSSTTSSRRRCLNSGCSAGRSSLGGSPSPSSCSRRSSGSSGESTVTKFTLVRQRTEIRTRLELMIRKKPSQASRHNSSDV